MILDIRRAAPIDFERVRAFYQSLSYERRITSDSVVFLAELDRALVGVVRLEAEYGVTVLRGMRVQPDHQRRGIGAALLEAVRQHLGTRECYCIAFAHLTEFYGRIGFGSVPADAAPDFLRQRCESYRRERDDIVLMWKPAAMEIDGASV